MIGRKAHSSPSIYPDDRESAQYDPEVFVNEAAPGHEDRNGRDVEDGRDGKRGGHDVPAEQNADALIFLRKILDEARSKRHDMVTHYTIDDLRVALGFARPGSDGNIAREAGERASPRPQSDQKSHGPGRRPRAGVRIRRALECTSLTRRFLMQLEPRKAPAAAARFHRSLVTRPPLRHTSWPRIPGRSSGRRPCAYFLLAALAAQGCSHEERTDYTSVSKPPTVRLIHPDVRKIVRVVGQPSFIEAYERTSIYPKMTAYIEKWIVDIGDKVKKGDVLATLFVPEIVEDYNTKKATVELDKERIDLALKMVDVADAEVQAARARLAQARANLEKYQAEVDRWDSEVKRLRREVERGVVDPQVLLESTNQLKSSTASRDAAQAVIMTAQAELLSKEASLAKAKVDVAVARADLSVAESDAKRLEAWVGYLTLTSPFDGIIVVRNANTFDFVLPSTGDPSAMQRSPDLSPSACRAHLRG